MAAVATFPERIAVIGMGMLALFLSIDVVDDLNHGSNVVHVMIEVVALSLSAALLGAHLIKFSKRLRSENAEVRAQVLGLEIERNRWREQAREALAGLAHAIDRQFEQWHLTASEKEVGLLILKGLAHKEIAVLRNTSERTVRQQAAAIYAKAGLEGKAQLAAFFLEDLMLPV